MPYFLSNENLKIGESSSITGEEADHIILARRAKVGEVLKVQGPDGRRFVTTVSEIKKHEVMIKPLEEIPVPAEPPVKITLFQSVVASSTLDVILQKATELGAAEIVLFNSEFTATHLTGEKFQHKLERFQKILWEAAKQSERAHPSEISFADDVAGVIKRAADLDKLVIFDIAGKKFNIQFPISNIGLIIGPEGGLSQDELNQFSALPNSFTASLGPILLKADTAAIAALAICHTI